MFLLFPVNYFFLKTDILLCEKAFGKELFEFLELAVAFIVWKTVGA